MEKLIDKAAESLASIRKQRPLIHYITNPVAANFAANALLAAGASPVMAQAEEEVGEIVSMADALALNIGVPTSGKISAMLCAGMKANEKGIPAVFDPVGSGGATFRTAAARQMIDRIDFGAIRGNPSEIFSLVSGGAKTRGVDTRLSVEDVSGTAPAIARKLETTIAITGNVDFITDGDRIVRVSNGSTFFGRVTGAGCALTGIMAAFLSVDPDPVSASASALSYFGVAGEMAEKECKGPGSFVSCFLDALCNIAPEDLKKKAKVWTGVVA